MTTPISNKRCIYFMVFAVLGVFIYGCSSGGGGVGEPYEYDVFPDDYPDPGSVAANCCGVTYSEYISGKTPPGGAYYWIGLLGNDSLVHYGDGVYIEDGNFENVELLLNVSYLDMIEHGEYEMRIFASLQDSGVGLLSSPVTFNVSKIVDIVDYSDSTCNECCSKSLRRYHVQATKYMGSGNSAFGAKAKIKTRLGKLCGDITKEAQSGAWCGIQNAVMAVPGDMPLHFLQIGFEIKRWEDAFTDTFIYIEFRPYNYYGSLISYFNSTLVEGDFPEEGKMYEYKCQIDTSIGKLEFYFDGTSQSMMTLRNAERVLHSNMFGGRVRLMVGKPICRVPGVIHANSGIANIKT